MNKRADIFCTTPRQSCIITRTTYHVGDNMRKIVVTTIVAAVVLSCASCGNEPVQSIDATASETTVTEVSATAAETEITTAASTKEAGWEGKWTADTGEYFEIYDVTEEGFKCRFCHYEEGQLELFDYDMEFDDEQQTTASEVGTEEDNGGWEYVFVLEGSSITVKWQGQELKYTRTKA